MNIAKSNLDIVENTSSKAQETLEIEMKKPKKSYSFDVPLEIREQWMIGVKNLEVYNTVYNITLINNKLKILLRDEQLKSLNIDTQLIRNVECLYKPSDNEFVEKTNTFIADRFSKNKKLIRKDFEYLK